MAEECELSKIYLEEKVKQLLLLFVFWVCLTDGFVKIDAERVYTEVTSEYIIFRKVVVHPGFLDSYDSLEVARFKKSEFRYYTNISPEKK